MQTTFEDLFLQLTTNKQVDVLATGSKAESLRTSFIRRWSKLKEKYDAVGMLSEDMRLLGVGMEKVTVTVAGEEFIGSRYVLRPRKAVATYTLVPTEST